MSEVNLRASREPLKRKVQAAAHADQGACCARHGPPLRWCSSGGKRRQQRAALVWRGVGDDERGYHVGDRSQGNEFFGGGGWRSGRWRSRPPRTRALRRSSCASTCCSASSICGPTRPGSP